MDEVENPGHEINRLFFVFDNKQRLFYIEAWYLRGYSPEKNTALSLAINEKFIQPLKMHKDIILKQQLIMIRKNLLS